MTTAAQRITLLCLDVDGVLTDGSILIDDRGVETKRFSVRDGAGMRLWTKLGYELAVITARKGLALRHRLHELGVRHVIASAVDKRAAFHGLLHELNVKASQAAMIGDDLADLPVMRLCGYPIAVNDAAEEVRAVASYTTTLRGGRGAVREAIEHLLKAQERWEEALEMYQ